MAEREGIKPREVTEEMHRADLPPYPGTPRWVKVFGIIAFVLVLLFGILHLTGGGLGPDDHGPAIEHGVQQP